MQGKTKIAEILEGLIIANNDRIKGYEKALDWLKDSNDYLTETFEDFLEQSNFNVEELRERIRLLGSHDGVDSGTAIGAIKRTIMDIKLRFTGLDVESVLETCESIEDDLQTAYRKALEDFPDLGPDIRGMLQWQKKSLLDDLTLLKKYRNDPSFGHLE